MSKKKDKKKEETIQPEMTIKLPEGKVIKDVKSLKTKSKLRTILHKGEIISVVEQMSAAEGAGHEI